MIIGYYQQAFFGGGTYYKLTKKDDETKYKIEYSHSAVPNYIPEAEKFIKKYETLCIEDDSLCECFEGKIRSKYLDVNKNIGKLVNYILKCNWEQICKMKYIDDDVYDGTNWELYIEINNKKYKIEGCEIYPKEIQRIIQNLDEISIKYLDKIEQNRKDKEIINNNRNNNTAVMKFLYEKKIINKKTLKDFIDKYKKRNKQ